MRTAYTWENTGAGAYRLRSGSVFPYTHVFLAPGDVPGARLVAGNGGHLGRGLQAHTRPVQHALLDLSLTPFVLYGVKYIDLVSLGVYHLILYVTWLESYSLCFVSVEYIDQVAFVTHRVCAGRPVQHRSPF